VIDVRRLMQGLGMCLALSGPGCERPEPERLPVYPVRGQVLYRDQPLAGALVVFEPIQPAQIVAGEQLPSSGITSRDGSFRLSTYEPNDGAPAGDYRVKIATAPRSKADRGILSPSNSPLDVLRDRYLDPKRTGLRAQVNPRSNELPPFRLR
jgi:hypothetical protein